MPLPYISGPLSRNVRNADELAYQIAATVASGLVQVPDWRPLSPSGHALSLCAVSSMVTYALCLE